MDISGFAEEKVDGDPPELPLNPYLPRSFRNLFHFLFHPYHLGGAMRRIRAYPASENVDAPRDAPVGSSPSLKREAGLMILEVSIPDEWPPGVGLAVARMVRQSLKEGFPVIVPVRMDATPEQLQEAFERVRTVIADAGLAA
jgi:hypothetical protein